MRFQQYIDCFPLNDLGWVLQAADGFTLNDIGLGVIGWGVFGFLFFYFFVFCSAEKSLLKERGSYCHCCSYLLVDMRVLLEARVALLVG